MKLWSLEIPEDDSKLARWLEAHLIDTHLAELVTELLTIQSADNRSTVSIDEVLGPHRHGVLNAGLAEIPRDMLRRMLREPTLLVDLQQLVLAEGGPFWDSVYESRGIDSNIIKAAKRRGWEGLQATHLARLDSNRVQNLNRDFVERPATNLWYARPIVASFATAAILLVTFFIVETGRRQQPAVGWGWGRPDALRQTASASEYLEALARSADEWFSKRPETAPLVARRLLELRQGCSVLILSHHGPLTEPDQKWLVEQCRLWAKVFDQELSALESGADPLAVRGAVDSTVSEISKELRRKASRLATQAKMALDISLISNFPPSFSLNYSRSLGAGILHALTQPIELLSCRHQRIVREQILPELQAPASEIAVVQSQLDHIEKGLLLKPS